jgi:hypothetical protein
MNVRDSGRHRDGLAGPERVHGGPQLVARSPPEELEGLGPRRMHVRHDVRRLTLWAIVFQHPAPARGFLGSLQDDKTCPGDRVRSLETCANHTPLSRIGGRATCVRGRLTDSATPVSSLPMSEDLTRSRHDSAANSPSFGTLKRYSRPRIVFDSFRIKGPTRGARCMHCQDYGPAQKGSRPKRCRTPMIRPSTLAL